MKQPFASGATTLMMIVLFDCDPTGIWYAPSLIDHWGIERIDGRVDAGAGVRVIDCLI